MARSGFNVRLAYMLWIRHLETGAIPVFAEIGRAVGEAAGGDALTGQAVSGWLKRDEAPDTYKNTKALASAFGVSADWLIEGVGQPPRPELWPVWLSARRGKPVLHDDIKVGDVEPRVTPRKNVRRKQA